MATTSEQTELLWGDGGPYSQVQVIREVRVLDDGLGRTFYYVKANVNPTTYATLKAIADQIADEEVQAFLRDATYISNDEGYEWHVYGQSALSSRGANRAAEKATDVVIRMHRLVMDVLQVGARPEEGPPDMSASEPSIAPPDEEARP